MKKNFLFKFDDVLHFELNKTFDGIMSKILNISKFFHKNNYGDTYIFKLIKLY